MNSNVKYSIKLRTATEQSTCEFHDDFSQLFLVVEFPPQINPL